MSTMVLVIIALLAGVAALIVVSLFMNFGDVIHYKSRKKLEISMERRMQEAPIREERVKKGKPTGYFDNIATGLQKGLEKTSWGQKLLGSTAYRALEEQMMLAGNPNGWGANEFILSSLFTVLGLGAFLYVALVVVGNLSIWWFVVFGAVTLAFPFYWIKSKINARQTALLIELPKAIGFVRITICSNASLDQALRALVKYRTGVLVSEIGQTIKEIMTKQKDELTAWEDMRYRCRLPEVDEFISAILQHKLSGVPLADTLLQLAELADVSYREKVNEKINSASNQLVAVSGALMIGSLVIMFLIPTLTAFTGTTGM